MKNTEILVIFKDHKNTYYDRCFNYKNKTLSFYRNLANLKGFGGGVEVIDLKIEGA
tara:strand:+ start:248 stop:415 length:168 start_codon:yes stop_codon:yes gene_type:complete